MGEKDTHLLAEDGWVQYLRGQNDDYPAQALQEAIEVQLLSGRPARLNGQE